mgnify:CR=1 FL=1
MLKITTVAVLLRCVVSFRRRIVQMENACVIQLHTALLDKSKIPNTWHVDIDVLYELRPKSDFHKYL